MIDNYIKDLHHIWRFNIDIVIKRTFIDIAQKEITDSIDKGFVKDIIRKNDTSNISLGLFNRLPRLHRLIEENIGKTYIETLKTDRKDALDRFRKSDSKEKIIDWIIRQSCIVPTCFNEDWLNCPKSGADNHIKDLYIYKFFEDDWFGDHKEIEELEGKVFNLTDVLVYFYQKEEDDNGTIK